VRILAFAYACEPGKGSEPGAGWGLARMLTEIGETWVLTRANNREAIETALPSVAEADRLRFVYVDLPSWAKWWKRGQRGVRLYYLLWLVVALRRAKQLQQEVGFDVVWHLTLANAWLGTTAGLVGPPFIYGPVGGGVGVPWRLFPALGARGAAYEVARALARALGRYVNPLARLSWRRADTVLVQNPETRRWLPTRHRSKARVFPNALGVDLGDLAKHRLRALESPSVALFAGRLLPLKGVALAIRALPRLPEWRLVIIGSGPDYSRLRRLANRLGLEERVEFRGWRPREEVLQAMREEADVFLFPSLHDEAGIVVAEALASGLPIVCVNSGGPPQVASELGAVRAAGPEEGLAAALSEVVRIEFCTFVASSSSLISREESLSRLTTNVVRIADTTRSHES
jgi:glycosyltransferase involved in cell wall biosynthesis